MDLFISFCGSLLHVFVCVKFCSSLLQEDDMLVELMLERLVGVVDAQLLEAVVLERFEAEDVQDAASAYHVCEWRV